VARQTHCSLNYYSGLLTDASTDLHALVAVVRLTGYQQRSSGKRLDTRSLPDAAGTELRLQPVQYDSQPSHCMDRATTQIPSNTTVINLLRTNI